MALAAPVAHAAPVAYSTSSVVNHVAAAPVAHHVAGAPIVSSHGLYGAGHGLYGAGHGLYGAGHGLYGAGHLGYANDIAGHGLLAHRLGGLSHGVLRSVHH